MISLSATLLAHQKLPSRRPYLRVTALAQRGLVPLFRWTRYYTGAEPDSPQAAAVPPNGTLIRARNDAGTVYTSKVATPGSGSTYSAWTSLGAVASASTGVALAAKAGEALLLYLNGTSVKYRTSTDDGASWSAEANLITEASAPTWIAVVYRPNGDACAFYNLGAAVQRIRRVAGAWAGASTAWTNSMATITGVAADHDGSDFQLALTGTDSAGAKKAYGCLMGDGGFPANVWAGLTEIAAFDAASTASFVRPSILTPSMEAHVWFDVQETATPTYNRVHYSRTMYAYGANSAWWLEPQPHEAQSNYGLSVATGDQLNCWGVTTSGVWYASINSQQDLSARVLSASIRFANGAARAKLTLDNTDGLLSPVLSALFPGCDLRIEPGYLSAANGTAEYGASWRLTVDTLVNEISTAGGRTVTARCVGPWELLNDWHAPSSWQVAQGVQSRGITFQRIASKLGYQLATGSTSAEWTSGQPAFAHQPNETGAALIERLLAVVTDHLRAEEGLFRVRDLTTGEASTFTYGGTGNHPIFTASAISGSAPANWVRVQGPDRYSDAFDPAAVYQHGNRRAQLRNLDMSTDAKVNAAATAALRRSTLGTRNSELVTPCNAGQELYDVVTINEPRLGITNQLYRVQAVGLEYARGPNPRPRYDTTLELGAL
jgi:hypothetical protein